MVTQFKPGKVYVYNKPYTKDYFNNQGYMEYFTHEMMLCHHKPKPKTGGFLVTLIPISALPEELKCYNQYKLTDGIFRNENRLWWVDPNDFDEIGEYDYAKGTVKIKQRHEARG